MKKLLFAVGVTLALVAGIATAAHATGPCGSSCDGKSPGITFDSATCRDNSFVVKSATSGLFTVRLNYSWWCQTAWADTDQVNVGVRVQSFRSNHTLRRTEIQEPTNANFRSTLMVDDQSGLTAVACEALPMSGGYYLCTDPF